MLEEIFDFSSFEDNIEISKKIAHKIHNNMIVSKWKPAAAGGALPPAGGPCGTVPAGGSQWAESESEPEAQALVLTASSSLKPSLSASLTRSSLSTVAVKLTGTEIISESSSSYRSDSCLELEGRCSSGLDRRPGSGRAMSVFGRARARPPGRSEPAASRSLRLPVPRSPGPRPTESARWRPDAGGGPGPGGPCHRRACRRALSGTVRMAEAALRPRLRPRAVTGGGPGARPAVTH